MKRDREYIKHALQAGKEQPKRDEALKWDADDNRMCQKVVLPEPKEFHKECVNYLAIERAKAEKERADFENFLAGAVAPLSEKN